MTKYVRQVIRRRWKNKEKNAIINEYRALQAPHAPTHLATVCRKYGLHHFQLLQWLRKSNAYVAFPEFSTVLTVGVREGKFPEMEKPLYEELCLSAVMQGTISRNRDSS